MTKARTPKQKAASRKNLEKARAARARHSSSNWIPGMDKWGKASVLHRKGEPALAKVRPIRQYVSKHTDSGYNTTGLHPQTVLNYQEYEKYAKSLRRKYVNWLKSTEARSLAGNRFNSNRGVLRRRD